MYDEHGNRVMTQPTLADVIRAAMDCEGPNRNLLRAALPQAEAADALAEVCELAAGFDRWRVTAKPNRCMPTTREVNERWSGIKSMMDAALRRYRGAK